MSRKKNTAVTAKDPVEIIDAIVRKHSVDRGATIPILQEIQQTFGYIAPEAITRISDLTGIPESEIYSIATFYAQFRLQPVGKYIISVCHGTACHLAGAEKISDAFEHATGAKAGGTSEDGLFSLEKGACLGCCSLAPVVNFNNETHARVTADKAQALVKAARAAAAKEKSPKGESQHGKQEV